MKKNVISFTIQINYRLNKLKEIPSILNLINLFNIIYDLKTWVLKIQNKQLIDDLQSNVRLFSIHVDIETFEQIEV